MSDTTLIKYLGEEAAQAIADNTKALLSNKVDKEDGKSLSTNDFTTEEKEKLASIEDGAQVNVIPDQDQSDSSATDYIKNRTHWTEYEREELLTDVTVTFDDGESAYETDIVIIEGEEYLVTFEGIEYKCKAKNFQSESGNLNVIYIGSDVWDSSANIIEPFVIGTVSNMPGILVISSIDELASATFSLIHLVPKSVHQLDQKYIPNSDWNAKEGETGHILNRTHYRELEEVLPETTFENVENGQVALKTKFNFEEGKKYIVNWNGIQYECEGIVYEQDSVRMVYIGDMMVSNPPFAIADLPEDQVTDSMTSMINVGDGSTTFTISIKCVKEFKKLDNEFLDLDWLPVMLDSDEMIISDVEITGSSSNVQAIEGFTSEYFVVGATYNIYLAGMKTTCKVKVMNDGDGDLYYLGNASLINTTLENTGEMFVIAYAPILTTEAFLKSFTDDTITLSIGKSVKVPNKLPNEYLDMDWYATDICKEEEILPKTEITSAFQYITSELTETIAENQLYVVYVNEDRYEFISKTDSSNNITNAYIGNAGLINISDAVNTGEPFIIYYAQGDGTSIQYYAYTDSYTLRICKGSYEPNKLPNKYLDLAWLPVMLPSEELFYEITYTSNVRIKNVTDFDFSLLSLNEQVIVYYNGTRYEQIVKNQEHVLYIGNWSIFNSEYKNTGEPFVIIQTSNNSVLIQTESSEVSIQVYKLSTENLIPNKIPAKFLPDDIGGGTTNIDKDWSQNDSSASNYIKNRTHWVDKVESIILPETTVTFTDSQSPMNGFTLVAGETYSVNWNGTVYEYVAEEYVEDNVALGVMIGNYGVLSGGVPTEEPFVFLYVYPEFQVSLCCEAMAITLDEIESATISITGMAEDVHKLDNKYLDLDWKAVNTKREIELVPEITVSNGSIIPGFYVYDAIVKYRDIIYYIDDERIEYKYKFLNNEIVGNKHLIDSSYPDTGESYAICIFGIVTIYFNDENQHTVSVKTYDVESIPEKYLPESIYSGLTFSNLDADGKCTLDMRDGIFRITYLGEDTAHNFNKYTLLPNESGKTNQILSVKDQIPTWVDPSFAQVQMITWEDDD